MSRASLPIYPNSAAREKRSGDSVIADLKRMYDDPDVVIPPLGFAAWRVVMSNTFSGGEPNKKRAKACREFVLLRERDFLIAAFEQDASPLAVMEHLASGFAEEEEARKAMRADHQGQESAQGREGLKREHDARVAASLARRKPLQHWNPRRSRYPCQRLALPRLLSAGR